MILHVVKSNIYSGAENVVCQIISGMDSEDFVYMSPRGPIEDKLKSLGLSYCYRGIEKLDVEAIKSAVEELKPSVVHAHDFTASVLCAVALKGSVPVVSHLHNNPPWIKGINPKTLSYLWASKWFSHILMVSDAVRDEYRFSSKIKCPMTVVGNPFSVASVQSKVPTICNAPDSSILFVGRLVEQKNPEMVIEVAEKLISSDSLKNHNLTIRLVGGGELKDSLDALIKEKHLVDVVHLHGFVSNPYEYMNNTCILIMPSRWEGFGLVALEGMALGKPVVCSGEGGLATIVNDSCGLICSSASDYANEITRLLLDEDYYTTKSSGANKRALEYDNIKSYCKQLENVYKGVSHDKAGI